MHASPSFYALVVAIYSVGEALGSISLGALSNALGIKRTLQLCALVSLSGSLSYALASSFHHAIGGATAVGPLVVLTGRLLQGIGSGGQQAVEQSYLAVAAPTEQRTSLTSQLNTFACLGFIFGPAMGAAVTQTPNFVAGTLHFNSFTKQGWVVAVLNVSMFLSTTFGFAEIKRDAAADADADDDDEGAIDEATLSDTARARERGRTTGVWAMILFFFIHFNGFAVQETITTPLVKARAAAHSRDAPPTPILK